MAPARSPPGVVTSPRTRTAIDVARRAEHVADLLHAERELRRVQRLYGLSA